MSSKTSLRILQIVLAVVLCAYSVELVAAQFHSGHHGHTFFVFLILGAVEAVAAATFIFAASVGGPALLATFAFAAALHVLHGEVGHVGVLLIYAAAVLAVMRGRRG